jgi:hypothetical protein
MPKTLAEWLAGTLLRWRLNSRVRSKRRVQTPSPQPRSTTVNLAFLDGFKTYIVAAAMLLAGISQLAGVDIPSFDGQSAGHLLMEGFAIIFLRRGIKAANS